MVETDISSDSDAKKAMIAGAIVVVVLGMVFAFSRNGQNAAQTGTSSQTGMQTVQSDNGQTAMQAGQTGTNQTGMQYGSSQTGTAQSGMQKLAGQSQYNGSTR